MNVQNRFIKKYRIYDWDELDELLISFFKAAPYIHEQMGEHKDYRRVRKIMLKLIEHAYKPEIMAAEETERGTIFTIRYIPRRVREKLSDSWYLVQLALPGSMYGDIRSFDTAVKTLVKKPGQKEAQAHHEMEKELYVKTNIVATPEQAQSFYKEHVPANDPGTSHPHLKLQKSLVMDFLRQDLRSDKFVAYYNTSPLYSHLRRSLGTISQFKFLRWVGLHSDRPEDAQLATQPDHWLKGLSIPSGPTRIDLVARINSLDCDRR
jgi:hypothetical protein